jgi:3-deoxy-7-phosphoheptulonate synthase
MLDARLVTKSHPDHRTVIQLSEQVAIGGSNVVIIGGPVR